MKLIVYIMALALGGCAVAPQASIGKRVSSVSDPSGVSLVLFDGSGSCSAPAHVAQLLAPNGKVKFNGCWVLRPHEDHMDVFVEWDDGDTTAIQADEFVKAGV